MNRVELIGGLTRAPEIRALSSGAMVCNFTVGWKEAVWSSVDRQDVVKNHYLSVVAWAELAEYVADQFQKGDTVYVLGVLTQDEIEKADGKKESKTRVRAAVVRPVRRARGLGDPAKVQQETASAAAEPPPF